jgi:hypothetical protein
MAGAEGIGRAFGLQDQELSGDALASLRLFDSGDPHLAELARRLELTRSALTELQDLQAMPFPDEGPYFGVTYLYYEGLAAVREAVLAGLSGLYHAAFAISRSALEMFVYHYWWRKRLEPRESYREFFDWLHGRVSIPGISKALSELYSDLDVPKPAQGIAEVKELYGRLCSYAHKPLVGETVTAMRLGARHHPDAVLLEYCLVHVEHVCRCALDISICVIPRCLFPVDVRSKFWVTAPTGVLLDEDSAAIVKAALGEYASEYESFFAGRDDVTSFLEWFHDQPDFNIESLLSNWEGPDPAPPSDPAARGDWLRMVCAASKAQSRATQRACAYSQIEDDIRELNARVEAVIASKKTKPGHA